MSCTRISGEQINNGAELLKEIGNNDSKELSVVNRTHRIMLYRKLNKVTGRNHRKRFWLYSRRAVRSSRNMLAI